jgi:hypothetical protein
MLGTDSQPFMERNMWPQYLVLSMFVIRTLVACGTLGFNFSNGNPSMNKSKSVGQFIGSLIYSAIALYVLYAGGFFVNL